MKNFFSYLAVFAFLVLSLFQGYLFYIASCITTQEFWMLTHIPGRCLLIK